MDRLVRRALATLSLIFILAAPAGAEGPPSKSIVDFNATLVDAMRSADTLGLEGRYEMLAPALTQLFNFPEMTRIAAGRHWQQMSAAEREHLTDVFMRMSITTYAARFDGYSGERFEVLGERPALRGSFLVENKIVKPSGETVPINYLLRQYDGEWRVVDVLLDAKYSELAVRRSEFVSILKSKGYDELISRLQDMIAKLDAKAKN